MPDQNFKYTQVFSNTGHALSHLFMMIYPTVVLALEVEFSQPYHVLISLMLAGNILFGAAALPAGYLGDKWGAINMMVVFFLGTGLSAILVGFANNEIQIVLSFALVGFFGSIYHPVGIAWIARTINNRGKALGINGVFGSAGMGIAPIMAGILTDLFSWRAAFIIPGIFCVAIGVILLVFSFKGLIQEYEPEVERDIPESPEGDMKKGILLLLFTVACTGLIYQATSFMLPKLIEMRLSDFLGDGLIGVGAMVSTIYFLSGGMQLLGGWMADRFQLKRVYLICWVLQVPLLIIAGFLNTALIFPVLAMMVVANTIGSPAENSLFARYSPPQWRSTAFGVKFVLALGVAALAVPLVSWAHKLVGEFTWLLVALAIIAVVAAIVTLMLPEKKSYESKEILKPVS
ncbi:MAG: MFS transporter [Nisaea sp.]|nr:MFS transporter [Nisaea sp.]MEC7971144.1 MFS transporter [Pseudomonadota bacterium]